MNITVVGAGNIGLAITGSLVLNTDNNVTLFTSSKKLDYRKLQLFDVENDKKEITTGFEVTDSFDRAFLNANIILCTYPAYLRKAFIEQVKDFLKPGVKLGFVPGYGGAEYFCKRLLEKGVIVFGLQRVPFVARYYCEEELIVASILSRKTKLFMAAIPSGYTYEIAEMLEKIFGIPTVQLKEYLAITLAPSNPLLHLTGLYNVFKNYKDGDCYNRPMRFYEEWNDDTSEMLLKYDAELQHICRELYPVELNEVVPLSVYYESSTAVNMTKKLKSIGAFKAVMVPLIKCGEKYKPDLSSRMFVEDYPYGICLIKAFGIMTNVKTPVIDKLLKFYEKLSGYEYFKEDGTYGKDIDNTAIPQLFGLNNKKDINKFYHKF